MTASAKLSHRFDELEQQLQTVFSTKHYIDGTISSGNFVDKEKYVNWTLKARNLIGKSCGEESLHFRDFLEKERNKSYNSNYDILLTLKAVFEAAREDFEGGYCASIRSLVQAEVFDSELEQARALLHAGYASAAAVVSGVVLETTLRQLCDNHGIAHSKLDKMNADLCKAGEYSVLRLKQITSWADIRNSAAHGHPEKFTFDDVTDMIDRVESFVAEILS